MNDRATQGYFRELLRRLHAAWVSILAQFFGIALLFAAGLAWTRIPEKHAWQVALSLLIPVVLFAAMFVLQAGTMRRLAGQDEGRVRLVHGALMLVAWAVAAWIGWAILDWCGDQVPLWAGYLNSGVSSRARARFLTYEHLQQWLTWFIWICRWIVLPGKLIPHLLASAQLGWRMPVRRVLRLLVNWRWWPAVIIAALVGVALPSHFFTGLPNGSVSHQVWSVVVKVVGTYLLSIVSWLILMAWCTVLLARQPDPAPAALDQQLLAKLGAGKRWILSMAVWLILMEVAVRTYVIQASAERSSELTIAILTLVLFVSLLVLQVMLLRSMISSVEKRVRIVWGTLLLMAWALPGLATAFLLDLYHAPSALIAICWVIIPGVLLPFAAASAPWGVRLPWGRLVSLITEWRWWIGVIAALLYGRAIPVLLLFAQGSSGQEPAPGEIYLLRKILANALSLASGVFLLAWFAALIERQQTRDEQNRDHELRISASDE